MYVCGVVVLAIITACQRALKGTVFGIGKGLAALAQQEQMFHVFDDKSASPNHYSRGQLFLLHIGPISSPPPGKFVAIGKNVIPLTATGFCCLMLPRNLLTEATTSLFPLICQALNLGLAHSSVFSPNKYPQNQFH